MHENLCNFIYDELDELDRKVKGGGKLSASDLEYADTLAHLKKSLLTNDAMEGHDGYSERGYSRNYPYYGDGHSYAPRRDAMGRYSRDGRYSYAEGKEAVREHLHMAMQEATDEKTRREIQRMIDAM